MNMREKGLRKTKSLKREMSDLNANVENLKHQFDLWKQYSSRKFHTDTFISKTQGENIDGISLRTIIHYFLKLLLTKNELDGTDRIGNPKIRK